MVPPIPGDLGCVAYCIPPSYIFNENFVQENIGELLVIHQIHSHQNFPLYST